MTSLDDVRGLVQLGNHTGLLTSERCQPQQIAPNVYVSKKPTLLAIDLSLRGA